MGIRFTRSLVVVVLALMVFGSGIAQAGILGNPTGTMGRGRASLGIEYDYRRGLTDDDVAVGSDASGDVEFLSKRYLARAGLGATDWLDLYFRIGAADLGFPEDNPGDPRFAGSTRFAMGGGFTLRLFEADNDEGFNTRALLIGQGLRFSSHGNAKSPIPNTTDSFTAFRNEYTWNEIDTGILFAVTTPSLDSAGRVRLTPYVGVEKTFIDGKIDRSEYLIAAGQKTLLGVESVDFADDGLTLRPVLGIEVNMPQNYSLAFEVTILDTDRFSFGVGISQVSALKRTVVKERASDYKL
jgi:hypothetical protein